MESRISQRLRDNAALVETALNEILKPQDDRFVRLFDSMKYSATAGGKRVRPFLTLEFCRMFTRHDKYEDAALSLACAVELVHCYSLIHDDLPCMDNDMMRRGKPTNHVVYGEATALLAGDALLTLAFEVISTDKNLLAKDALRAVTLLASSAGAFGMIGGQQLDLIGETVKYDADTLEYMQNLKTGKLIEAACLLGVTAARLEKEERRQAEQTAREYAAGVGLAFQIKDDLLDVSGDENLLGKPLASDAKNNKITFMEFMDTNKAAKRIDELTESAAQAVLRHTGGEILAGFARFLATRDS